MVVNLAARFSRPPRSAPWSSARNLCATNRVFVYASLEPVALRESAPAQTLAAGSPRARLGADIIRDLSTPMVGRQRDLSLLCTAFEKAAVERLPQLSRC